MGERMWWCAVRQHWRASECGHLDCGCGWPELLAEMPTEALVDELRRRRDLNKLCTCGMCWPLGALWP